MDSSHDKFSAEFHDKLVGHFQKEAIAPALAVAGKWLGTAALPYVAKHGWKAMKYPFKWVARGKSLPRKLGRGAFLATAAMPAATAGLESIGKGTEEKQSSLQAYRLYKAAKNA